MTYKGARGPHYKGERTEWFSGQFRRTRRWEGTEIEIRGLEPGFQSVYDGYTIERIGDSPIWFAEAFVAGLPEDPTEDIVDTYELLTNTVQQPSRYSAVLKTKLTESEVALIEREYNKLRDPNQTYTYAQATTKINTDVVNSGNGLDLLDDMIAGVNNFFEFEYVFRRTRQFHSSAGITPVYTNSGKIYTTSSALITAEGIDTTDMLFSLPVKEWLKIPPQVRLQFEGRVEIIYEYWAADVWSRNYYNVV